MAVLTSRLEYIKNKEARIRQELGFLVKITNYTGIETPAPGAEWDPFRKQWTIPPIKETVTYEENALVRWINQVEYSQLPAGLLNIGDCILLFRSEVRTYIEKAIVDKNVFEILTKETTPTIIKVVPVRCHLTDLNTQIEVYARRL